MFLGATAKSAGKARLRMKFKKLDVIATFLLIQDLSRSEHFKFDKKFYSQLAAHILADKETGAAGKSTSGPAIAQYYESWRAKIIDELGIHRDPKRLFDETEKTYIYKRDGGKCGVCKEDVDQEEAEYDHYRTPHTLGGKTVVENGRLVHSACHQRGPVEEEVQA